LREGPNREGICSLVQQCDFCARKRTQRVQRSTNGDRARPRQAEPGLSLRALADRLNEKRLRTPLGKARTAAQVERVLDRIRSG
jgi:hypothetical protein